MKEEQERLQAELDRKKTEKKEKQVRRSVARKQTKPEKQKGMLCQLHLWCMYVCVCLRFSAGQVRERLELAQQYVEDDWVSEAEAILAEQWELDEMTTSSDSDEHRCIVCNKSFKSEKQYVCRR